MSLASVVFVQQVRTPSSEVWVADRARGSNDQLAQIDIHYPPGRVEVTVALLRPMAEADLSQFLDMIDDELISAGQVEKGTLNFRVIQGGKNTAELLTRGSAGGGGDIDLLGGFGNG
jgi:hypothetical protein